MSHQIVHFTENSNGRAAEPSTLRDRARQAVEQWVNSTPSSAEREDLQRVFAACLAAELDYAATSRHHYYEYMLMACGNAAQGAAAGCHAHAAGAQAQAKRLAQRLRDLNGMSPVNSPFMQDARTVQGM
jgi:hypothetical protein